MAHEPWSNLGFYEPIEVGREWLTVCRAFVAREDDDRARLHFDLGNGVGPVDIASVSVAAWWDFD